VAVAFVGLVVTATTTTALAGPEGPARTGRGEQAAAAAVPAGTTVLLDSGAWSWFEDERAMLDFAGDRLYVSAVAHAPTAGEVVVGEIDMADGTRRVVGLGGERLDDHNSAALWEASDTGEILTAWAGHNEDSEIRTHRRRTDGSWLRLPPVSEDSQVTYSNLYEVLREDGTALLYDFYRGTGYDPEAMVSADGGRTWSQVGQILSDPADLDGKRPYVRYASRGDRIDLIATEEHPDDTGRTSIYHGYIRDGIIHTSTGTPLGPVGTGISVTSLTSIWSASATEEGWTVDLGYDDSTGQPIAAFSSTISVDDHRYYVARFDGRTWQPRQVAHAGRALYAGQPHYTGLVALDPRDGDHVVISTDVDPTTGAPLQSASDGRRHWELYDGRRRADGSYSWTALTSNSTSDNLRPVITTNDRGAWVLAWFRGRYTSYSDYATQVVGVVRRTNGSTVATSAAAARRPVIAGITDPGPAAQAGVPVAGRFDGHEAGDLFVYRSGTGRDDLVIGDDGQHPVHVNPTVVNGSYTPVPGDFDADDDTDILWYAPGTAPESTFFAQSSATFASRSGPTVNGSYTPVPGDFDGDDDTDILWYAPGTAADSLWLSDGDGSFTSRSVGAVNGNYRPIPGDFDGDGDTDVLWYAPGSGAERLWLAEDGGTFTSTAAPGVGATYTPVPGDFDGDGDTDVFWYGVGSAGDFLWLAGRAAAPGSAPSFDSQPGPSAGGSYRPVASDMDGNGRDDIYWYAPGGAADFLWWSGSGPFTTSVRSNLNL
jgi:putative BNR repeat neuraminidase/VCBS repeat protein